MILTRQRYKLKTSTPQWTSVGHARRKWKAEANCYHVGLDMWRHIFTDVVYVRIYVSNSRVYDKQTLPWIPSCDIVILWKYVHTRVSLILIFVVFPYSLRSPFLRPKQFNFSVSHPRHCQALMRWVDKRSNKDTWPWNWLLWLMHDFPFNPRDDDLQFRKINDECHCLCARLA